MILLKDVMAVMAGVLTVDIRGSTNLWVQKHVRTSQERRIRYSSVKRFFLFIDRACVLLLFMIFVNKYLYISQLCTNSLDSEKPLVE